MDTSRITATAACPATMVTTMDGRTTRFSCTKTEHPAREAHAHVTNGVTVVKWWGPGS